MGGGSQEMEEQQSVIAQTQILSPLFLTQIFRLLQSGRWLAGGGRAAKCDCTNTNPLSFIPHPKFQAPPVWAVARRR